MPLHPINRKRQCLSPPGWGDKYYCFSLKRLGSTWIFSAFLHILREVLKDTA